MKDHREIEAKFYLPELSSIRKKLIFLGAQLSTERVFERNWRFDTAKRRFEDTGEVLRVRQDIKAHLTYKRPTEIPENRIEIELEVDDGESATEFLNALGFEVVALYEKYREIFFFEDCSIFLDELPFGSFVEVEGNSIEAIRNVADSLDLEWKKRVPKNYLDIFKDLVTHLGLPFSDASFENFDQVDKISAQDIRLQSASKSSEIRS
ncbi:MAG: class IV adenylate cyclase [Anaerolineales bacterium]|nr:class IV adenylate cyclase [Anaerolineales bacterium]